MGNVRNNLDYLGCDDRHRLRWIVAQWPIVISDEETMLDYTIENLRGMVGFVDMARNPKNTAKDRHTFLMMAVMHACQASEHEDSRPDLYGFTITDYKHVLIGAAKAVMNGTPINEAMANVPEYKALRPIDWNYLSKV